MTYPNEALTDICTLLLDDWMLDPTDIAHLAKDIAAECESILQSRSEQAWEERSFPDDSAYRRDMVDAGRGHLLGDR